MSHPKDGKKTEMSKHNKGDKSVSNQPSTDISGQNSRKPLRLKDTEKLLKKHNLELKRIEPSKRTYRSKKDLPDPEQAPNAEVNRLKKQFKMRMLPELLEKVDLRAKEIGVSRQDYITLLIERDLDIE